MSPLLKVTGLTVEARSSQGAIYAVRDLDLTLWGGDLLGIIGESGSGKTTAVRALIGLLERNVRIVGGTIEFQGEQIWPGPRDSFGRIRGRHIGMIFQSPRRSLNPVRTAGSQIDEVLRVLRPDLDRPARKERIWTVLARVGFDDVDRVLGSYPHQLSGGMCQRVAIAMAVAPEPSLLIADEATSALDVTTQAQVVSLLRELCEHEDRALMFVTHDLMLAASMCTRMIVMYAGSAVETGPADQLVADARHRYSRALLEAVPVWEPKHQLRVIEGSSEPIPVDHIGCAFRRRCDAATSECENPLEVTEVHSGHRHWCVNPVVRQGRSDASSDLVTEPKG